MANVSVLGAGAFGTTLALYARRLGHRVRVWVYDAGLPGQIAKEGENRPYLPGVKIPKDIDFTGDMAAALVEAELVLIVCPSAHVRRTARAAAGHIPTGALIVSAAKGIEGDTLYLMSQVLEETLPAHRDRLSYLSGPSFAKEIAAGKPVDVAVAARDIAVAHQVQALLHSPGLRVYTSDDVIGVELGGALKNIIAVACGAADGLGFGASARAALMTRGLAEIARLGVALGARPITFLGLSGVGDLILTCTGDLSRNRALGKRLAAGEKPEDIVSSQKAVAEAYHTSRPAYKLAQREKVDMPIITAVYRVLYEGSELRDQADLLMSRESKDEFEGIFPRK